MIAVARTALPVLAVATAMVVTACGSDPAGAPARSTAAPASTRPASSLPASSHPASSPQSAPSDGGTPSSSAGSGFRAADPARYHVGSVGPGDPVRSDSRAVSFQTPSRNIRCTVLEQASVTCEIGEHSFRAAPRPADCTNNWLATDVSLGGGPARQGVCAGNPVVLANSTVLPYGYRLTVGRIACDSTDAAVTCTSGVHGFTLSRTAVSLR